MLIFKVYLFIDAFIRRLLKTKQNINTDSRCAENFKTLDKKHIWQAVKLTNDLFVKKEPN